MAPRSSRLRSELVWVVPREIMFPQGAWRGVCDQGVAAKLARIEAAARFIPREAAEDDPAFQQIIPYVVFRHEHRYLLTKRLKASSERRLHHLYSVGVGGHVNPPDNAQANPVADGLRREWQEEVQYPGPVAQRLLGLIKDDSTPVGRVHLGLVFLLEGEHPRITIRETGKLEGALLTLEEMRAYYLDMESWSQIIYDYLTSHPIASLLRFEQMQLLG